MATPKDRVQLRKNESAADGGDAADDDMGFPALLDPNEDAPEVQGVFFQPPLPSSAKDEEVFLTRDASNNMVFRDPIALSGTEVTLSALLAGGFDINTVITDDITGDVLVDDITGNVLVNQ